MADVVIEATAGRAKVVAFLRDLPGILSGRLPDRFGIAAACRARLVHAALEDVWADFDRKSAGGAGEDGTAWEPLHPYTIRERSRQRGESGRPGAKALSQEDYRWLKQSKREIYLRELRRLLDGGVARKEAVRQASIVSRFLAQGVWAARNKALGLKGQEGRPAGPEDFPILDDSGRLKRSVSPGQLSGSGLTSAYEPGGDPGDQEVSFDQGRLRVESNVPYGDPHMRPGRGSKTGGFRPARPWKYPGDVPDRWAARWAEVFAQAVRDCLPEAIARL